MPDVGQKLPTETQLEGQGDVLVPEQAPEEEKGVLQKFERLGGGKMKRVIASLMLGSALVFSAGAFEAHAAEKKQGMGVEQVEKEKNILRVLEDIYNMKPNVENPAAAAIMKKKGAKTLIYNYAARRKGLAKIEAFDPASEQAMQEALEELNSSIQLLANKLFGKGGDKFDPDAFTKLQQEARDNIGITVLRDMIAEYKERARMLREQPEKYERFKRAVDEERGRMLQERGKKIETQPTSKQEDPELNRESIDELVLRTLRLLYDISDRKQAKYLIEDFAKHTDQDVGDAAEMLSTNLQRLINRLNNKPDDSYDSGDFDRFTRSIKAHPGIQEVLDSARFKIAPRPKGSPPR